MFYPLAFESTLLPAAPLVACVALASAYYIERRAWTRMLALAFVISECLFVAIAIIVELVYDVPGPVSAAICLIVLGAISLVLARASLRRRLVDALSDVRTRLARKSTVADDRARNNRAALKLLRASGWRPGSVRETVTDANGVEHKVWAPPAKPPIGMRIHGWASFLPTVALGGFIVWALSELPSWARPIAEVGVGIGVLGHLGWLPNPLHWIGL